MALMITEECTICNACIEPCPNEAITAAEPLFIIDPMRCTECVGAEEEPQCMVVCPSECIVPNPDWSETEEELLAKYEMSHS